MSSRSEQEIAGKENFDLGSKIFEEKKYAEAEPLLRRSLSQRERALGAEHKATLESRYLLAFALHYQEKDIEAEPFFRSIARQREKALGSEHIDTLEGKYLLAVTLHYQWKHTEAEPLLRSLTSQREKVLGAEHVDTLKCKYTLALSLHSQEKNTEAESLLRELVRQREKGLGVEHVDTIQSRYMLAFILRIQDKYAEAEPLLRESARQREKILGIEHRDTIQSRYMLAVALLYQQKYIEAEMLLRESVQQRERLLSREHEETLWSKYRLGVTLHKQQKYIEAEVLLRESVMQQEKLLGREHTHTLDSKYELAVTLQGQQKYIEARLLLQELIQQQEKVLSAEHKDTLKSKRLLQEILRATGLPNSNEETVASYLRNYFPEDKSSRTHYTDSEISKISLLLNQANPKWRKVPRTYIILRMIGCLEFLDKFIDLGFSDHWFPVSEKSIPHCLRPSQRSEFVTAQNMVITKSIDLEKGKAGHHCNFRQNESLPFEEKGILGTGGFGQVDKVLSQISFREFARKRVLRSTLFGGRRMESVKRFIAEIEILKRIEHRHVIEFVGSYTDARYMGLIMSPVADMDLSTYLIRTDVSKHGELRTFFGCLARALEFLHEQKVRHKDIKPANILVHGGNILFTDFGLSFDFADADGSTTVSMVNAMTPRYCAPEVAMEETRNTSSDIWSLGIVFLEMIVVLKGKTVEYMYKFLMEHGSRQAFIRTNHAAFLELITELKGTKSLADNIALAWVQDMVQREQDQRPTAASLVASIVTTSKGEGNGSFCGICCISPDDDFSDGFDVMDFDEL